MYPTKVHAVFLGALLALGACTDDSSTLDGGVPDTSLICNPICSILGQPFECGDDGCGGSCGTCTAPEVCGGVLGVQCVPPTPCVPNCDVFGFDRECGSDGCGGSCGTCADGEECEVPPDLFGTEIDGWRCVCAPDCDGRECGDAGCGGLCGVCDAGSACDSDGQCPCVPSCSIAGVGPKECGGDGCGGVCPGTVACPSGEACSEIGFCVCDTVAALNAQRSFDVDLTQGQGGDLALYNGRISIRYQAITLATDDGNTPLGFFGGQCEFSVPANSPCIDISISFDGWQAYGTALITADASPACESWLNGLSDTGFTLSCAGTFPGRTEACGPLTNTFASHAEIRYFCGTGASQDPQLCN